MFERCVPCPKDVKLGPVIDISVFLDCTSYLLLCVLLILEFSTRSTFSAAASGAAQIDPNKEIKENPEVQTSCFFSLHLRFLIAHRCL